jgi:sugar/nucleoside kinase (ribokinase family)
MSLLVVGSVAFDSVKTPFGEVEKVLGGSASYFSTAASYFTEVRLVAVVGDDFPEAHWQLLANRGVRLEGLQKTAGKTFQWRGEYGSQLNEAKTLDTQLNVFESFRPKLPDGYADSSFVFLANIDPELQLDVLRQVRRPKWVACDTMNFWIGGKRDTLVKVLGSVDLVIINEGEARELTGETNLVRAAKQILGWGAKTLMVKRGEYGVAMFNAQTFFAAPAYLLENVFDPTGAGDSFAGGVMGYLSQVGRVDDATLRQAVIYGSVMASFNVEAFSLDRLCNLTQEEITARYRHFKALTHFEEVA